MSNFDLFTRQGDFPPPVDYKAEEAKAKEHASHVWNIPRVQRLDAPGCIRLTVRSDNWECDAWLKVRVTVLSRNFFMVF
jgi:hypothetical protein